MISWSFFSLNFYALFEPFSHFPSKTDKRAHSIALKVLLVFNFFLPSTFFVVCRRSAVRVGYRLQWAAGARKYRRRCNCPNPHTKEYSFDPPLAHTLPLPPNSSTAVKHVRLPGRFFWHTSGVPRPILVQEHGMREHVDFAYILHSIGVRRTIH